MRVLRVFLLAAVAALVAGGLSPASAGATVSVDVGFFYDSLAPHGQWIASADFGYVWRPLRVGVGWRPYYDGRWIYTDYGWTFVSDDPWGWATYHYGRWYFDPIYGWLWVPGYEWAPAWVVFHQGSGWIGWAPLPPRVSLSVVLAGGYRYDPRVFCFVEERHFTDRRIGSRVVRTDRNRDLFRATANVTRYARSGDRYLQRGVHNDRIERATRSRIERRRVVDVVEVRGARSRVDSDRVTVFRPQVSRRASPPPARVTIHESNRQRSQAIERRAPERRQSPPQVERGSDRSRRPETVSRQSSSRGREADRKSASRGKPKPPPRSR